MTTFYRRLPQFEYVRPKTLAEALSLLSRYGESARVLAGGTDLIPGLKAREIRAPRYVVDLKAVPELGELSYDDKRGLTIGPLATITAVERSQAVRAHFLPLSQAAATMASPQIRGRGTVVGNICSAVPSADTAPALLALEAAMNLKSATGERSVPLDSFFTGPRTTVMENGEMVVAITVPKMAPGSKGVYLKLSPRRSMDLAVVGVAVAGIREGAICRDVKIGLGAVAPTPVRARMAEEMLRGKTLTPELIDEAARNAITQCSPIDDHRASREYRCDMVYTMTRRALNQVFFSEGEGR